MITFRTPQEIKFRSSLIENAKTLEDVIRLSSITVGWSDGDSLAEDMRLAYENFKETMDRRLTSFVELGVA